MRDVVIVGAARTAIGRAGKGSLRFTRPDDLAAAAISAAIKRAGVDPGEVEDVILGCAQPELEQGLNVARLGALLAGLPDYVPGLQVNRFCASGLEAVAIAAQRIASGAIDVAVAGGTESMSMVTFLGPTTRPNPRLLEVRPDTYLSMGLSVEQLASRYGITREESDVFAVESHRKAVAAQDAGRFDAEIAPLCVQIEESDEAGVPMSRQVEFARDEGPRRDTSLESLAKLKPAFTEDGIITAGNASPRSDGAAALVLMAAERAESLGLKPLLRFVAYAVAAVTPQDFGIGPTLAIPRLLKHASGILGEPVGVEDIDLIEFNEAFAAQVLCALKDYPLPTDRMNVNGGAIALGHPLGATGARQTITLAYEMARRGSRLGLVTMCAALGMGAAALFERA